MDMDTSPAYPIQDPLQHVPMDLTSSSAPYSHPPSASSSTHSSPHQFHPRPMQTTPGFSPHQQYAHTRHHSRVSSAGSATSLHISTMAAGSHEHELDEQTAHPLRVNGQSSVDMLVENEQGHERGQANGEAETRNGDTDAETDTRDSSPGGSSSSIVDAMADGQGLSRPLTHHERENITHLDRLKFFLATAPSRWSSNPSDPSSSQAVPPGHPSSPHPALNRFLLPSSEFVSCVLWGGLYHITGTDIVRALVFRFEAFGRPVRNMKKFEEGVFSDLRNLKPGVDACLEEPKSPFLDLLFKYQCIRTQKKQKVFYWFSVPHDRLFLDALERDLKREKMGLEPTTVVTGEPALSFTYDPKRSLYEQFSKVQNDGEGELEAAVRVAEEGSEGQSQSESEGEKGKEKERPKKATGPNSPFFSMFSLFEGSPTYKQRRKKVGRHPSSSAVRRYGPGSGNGTMTGEMYVDEYGQAFPLSAPQPFGSMSIPSRVPEPQLDRFGRDITRMSAAEMFNKQAQGDFGGQSNPDLVASQKERQRRAIEAQLVAQGQFGGLSRAPSVQPGPSQFAPGNASANGSMQASLLMQGTSSPAGSPMVVAQQLYQPSPMQHRPNLEARHTLPSSTHTSMSYQQQPALRPDSTAFPHANVSFPNGWPPSAPAARPTAAPAQRSTKAFVCPLYLCGRMFKRMEHLKRHLRTHTLERPYQCQHCSKRFSRSDNLNQHMRTHMRVGSDGAMVLVLPESGSNGVSDAESEEVDELEGDDAAAWEMHGVAGEYINGVGQIGNVQMYEVEVQGPVQEVQGDEEGLVMPTGPVNPAATATAMDTAGEEGHSQGQDAYYTAESMAQMTRDSPEQHGAYGTMSTHSSPGGQWTTILRPESSMSVSSYAAAPSQSQQHVRMGSVYGSSSEYVTSISAPSHKATFDHATLYPQDLELTGPGPIRRHRSATPSVPKFGEAIRRPFSAALSDHGTANVAGQRSFHPYAVSGHYSAESSPMAYSMQLAQNPNGQMAASASRSHSRSSSGSHLQDQMAQMVTYGQQQQGAVQDQAMYIAHNASAIPSFAPTSDTTPMQYAPTDSYELVNTMQTGGTFQQNMSVYESYAMANPQTAQFSGTHHYGAETYPSLASGNPHQVLM
ncbi:uncharacterized protein LAESUDRAFT_556844 [Laetiporus sulphureus 93-53]|uniref:C2H2-type domain-containing protein n=1 Tax=Laetiporus sulphureus 93-53 TaxID=1314785 RepID=A0A165B759_9APHY|nr:uncharacterized protein LAESUDRAFT_556844 [Laetiporus sulphureus 93-53]KZT00401.1 hypothetical protein LAESUDRAFT_556844 [Laetiporus sulphureus 93-53]